MKHLVFLWLVAAAVFGAGMASACARGPELTALTYNIRYDNPGDGENRWEKRRELVYQLIRDHDPDVIGLQEALRHQLDELAKALPAYGEIGVGRDDGKTKGEYAAILYRKERFAVLDSGTFWFGDTPEQPGSKSWGNRITRICTWARLRETAGGKAFWMYNVHLDHESENSRSESVELLCRRIGLRPGHDPVLVTGDFNAGELSTPIRTITQQTPDRPGIGNIERSPELRGTFRIVHRTAAEAGTFNNFGKPGGRPEKIDYILIGRGSDATEAGIDRRSNDGRFPSDHHAVWAKVVLAEP